MRTPQQEQLVKKITRISFKSRGQVREVGGREREGGGRREREGGRGKKEKGGREGGREREGEQRVYE